MGHILVWTKFLGKILDSVSSIFWRATSLLYSEVIYSIQFPVLSCQLLIQSNTCLKFSGSVLLYKGMISSNTISVKLLQTVSGLDRFSLIYRAKERIFFHILSQICTVQGYVMTYLEARVRSNFNRFHKWHVSVEFWAFWYIFATNWANKMTIK